MTVQVKTEQPDIAVKTLISGSKESRIKDFLSILMQNKAALAGAIIIFVYLLMAAFAPLLAPYSPYEIDLENKLTPPSADHWMGTDDKGRDILSRILYGSRLSMGVGFAAVLFGAFFGIIFGLVAGYYGKWVDTIIMRMMDVMLAFPGILLALAIIAALGPSLINVTIAVGAFSVPLFARIVRGSTLEVKRLEYIDAIRSLGASDFVIISRHIFPNILSPIIVQGTLRLATAILSAAGLSFLGLGAQPPSPEWGTMLSSGRDFLFSAPYIALFPGLAISILVLGFNIFGDGLRDAFDPRMKK
ncbi:MULTISPECIES: ABC transporter permease [Cytobacillus]|jgi:peptide/nickel transport system permease protein|uniref:Diguanylate cyclase n=2 Tax=Cytobacillus TaxID=2675230 RepID=A0ABX3CYY3_9BACI|nr:MULTISPECIES: ABC transporter permease [Cytobacillus]MBY0155924.1 ABC transporter permease [Cytobacillus firmus]MBU8729927.1 ABC transporter permease [Cytobacillus oceanisediminis]MCM3241747.1 ABC transporter permease [Cytobacillus oceanisediminis]MCM3390829.1 ABC transporter permease [Cytobacillus oceanisediminis]MCM3403997.1 ABC transporter permease [Cytobacillus oceanisediminis]